MNITINKDLLKKIIIKYYSENLGVNVTSIKFKKKCSQTSMLASKNFGKDYYVDVYTSVSGIVTMNSERLPFSDCISIEKVYEMVRWYYEGELYEIGSINKNTRYFKNPFGDGMLSTFSGLTLADIKKKKASFYVIK